MDTDIRLSKRKELQTRPIPQIPLLRPLRSRHGPVLYTHHGTGTQGPHLLRVKDGFGRQRWVGVVMNDRGKIRNEGSWIVIVGGDEK